MQKRRLQLPGRFYVVKTDRAEFSDMDQVRERCQELGGEIFNDHWCSFIVVWASKEQAHAMASMVQLEFPNFDIKVRRESI